MASIIFTAAFGDELKEVEISQAGGGGDSWQIYIDRYYQGRILNIDPLRHDINPNSELTTEDIHIIVDMIKELE